MILYDEKTVFFFFWTEIPNKNNNYYCVWFSFFLITYISSNWFVNKEKLKNGFDRTSFIYSDLLIFFPSHSLIHDYISFKPSCKIEQISMIEMCVYLKSCNWNIVTYFIIKLRIPLIFCDSFEKFTWVFMNEL